MNTFDTLLVHREEVAEGTSAFHFKKPVGFAFKPGQAIDLILADPKSPGGDASRHAFSLVSAPHQSDLVIATRMRDSAYKRLLGSLALGAPVKIEGPFGSLALHRDDARTAVFIAGGIGITPFMSMLRQAARDDQSRDVILIYSNRRPEDAAFLRELQEIEKEHKRFRLVATMTGMDKSRLLWDGPIGTVNGTLISSAVESGVVPVYYLVGPPGMVEAMKVSLSDMGVSDDDIRSEEFYGY